MPTLLVEPPELRQRMAFMDAMENADIEYERIPDGYVIFLSDERTEKWNTIRERFSILSLGKNPPLYP